MLSPELGCSGWRNTLPNTEKTHLCLNIRTKPIVKPCRQTKLPPQNKTRKAFHEKSHPGYSCTKPRGKEKGQFLIDFPASNSTAGRQARRKQAGEDSKLFIRKQRENATMVTWLAGHREGWELQTATSRLSCLKPKVRGLWAGRLSCNKMIRKAFFRAKRMLVLCRANGSSATQSS